MEPTFKILQNITCGFEPNEVRTASEFPKGTDFKRLVDIGAIRPTSLKTALPSGNEKADLLDQIEELQYKLGQAEAKAEKDAQVAADTVDAQTKIIAKLTQERDDAQLQITSLVNDAKPKEATPVDETKPTTPTPQPQPVPKKK